MSALSPAVLLPAVPRTAEPAIVAPSVVTPLGVLGFSATVDHWTVPALPSAVDRLPGGGRIFRWEHEIAELELLLCPFEPLATDFTLPVDGCWGAVWRVTARERLGRVALSAAFHAVPEDVESSYDGGQGLAAVALWTGETELTLGCPDEEDICSRAEYSADLPRRWAALLAEVYKRSPRMKWGVNCLDDDHGLRWALPPLEQGEHCVLHAAVSWRTPAPEDDEDDVSTWWAVFVRAEHILGAAAAAAAAGAAM